MWVLQNKSSIVYLQAGNMQQYLEANALNSAQAQICKIATQQTEQLSQDTRQTQQDFQHRWTLKVMIDDQALDEGLLSI